MGQELSLGFLALYGRITAMLAAAGIGTEIRALDPDITSGTRSTGDRRFEDGNLHILNSRNVHMPNVLNGATAYLPGYWHLDPHGTRCYSSIGARTYREDMVPFRSAKTFYAQLQSEWKDERRSRYTQPAQRRALPDGAVSVFFQGRHPKKIGATSFSDIAILRDVLRGGGDRPVLVKPHPRVTDVGTLIELSELMEQDSRITITDANIHDVLAASCATVSVNSAVAIEGFLHRTPAILYGTSDFHHHAETVTAPGQFAAALARAVQRKGGYAQYMTWYFRRNCLRIGAADLEARIWEIFAAAGFPPARFAG